MVAIFTCRYFFPYDDCNPGEVDEIETIIQAKSLYHVLKIEEYRAYFEIICLIFDSYARSY